MHSSTAQSPGGTDGWQCAITHRSAVWPMDQLPVKLWDTASAVPYFLLVKCCANEADFEGSTLDIEATDGTMRWSIKGLTRPGERAMWMHHVHRALTSPGEGLYEYQFTRADSELKLTVRWRQEGLSGRVRADIVMPKAQEADSMQRFLTSLFEQFAAIQKAHDVHSSQAACYKQESEQFRVVCEQYAGEKAKQDGELFTKFAAVLNQKKLTIRKLRKQCEGLEQRLQENEEGADAGTEGGRSSGSRAVAEESNEALSGVTMPEPRDEQGEAASMVQDLRGQADSLQPQQQEGEGGSYQEALLGATPSNVKQESPSKGDACAAALLEAPTQSLQTGAAADVDMVDSTKGAVQYEESDRQELSKPVLPANMAKRRRR